MVEVNWKVLPVSTTVTLMTERMIAPFCSSRGGGAHVMFAEREEVGTALKFSGGAVGAEGEGM